MSGLKELRMKFTQEYQVAVLMAFSAMFTLIGYEFIRSAATVLFKTAWGPDKLPLVMLAMPFVVFAGVVLYGWILSQLGPRRTLLVTSLGSSFIMLGCYLLLQLNENRVITPVLFLFKEFYIVLLIEQYWSYINSSVVPATAKKVNGPVTGIAGLGGALGGYLVSVTAEPLGAEAMVLLAAVALLPAALVSNLTYRHYGEPEQPEEVQTRTSLQGAIKGPLKLKLFLENPLLLSLIAIVVTSQVLAAVLDFEFQTRLSAMYQGEPNKETAIQGRFWGTLNTFVLVLQFVVAPLLLSYVSLRQTHLLMPLVHLIAIGVALAEPNVYTVGVAFFLFKALDYSIFRAAKELLYVPLSFDERYRAKEVIDVFGYRAGKGGSALMVVAFQKAGVMVHQYYLMIGFCVALVWVTLVFPLTRKNQNEARVNKELRQ